MGNQIDLQTVPGSFMSKRWTRIAGTLTLSGFALVAVLSAMLLPWLPTEVAAHVSSDGTSAAVVSLANEHRDHRHGTTSSEAPRDAHVNGVCACCSLHSGESIVIESPAVALAPYAAGPFGSRTTQTIRPEAPPPQL